MNPHIQKLYTISQKPERRIIGLMSGTSLDGLDVALCSISGSGIETVVSIEGFETVNFDDTIKAEIKKVFSKKEINLQHLCLLNAWIGTLHGEMINDCLNKWGENASEIDLIASHGQTIFHAPKSLHRQEKFPNATLQIGDGDHIAVKTGIITLSDFRQKHIAAGGEGAPLAVYGDYILFIKSGEDRIMLNIGGIANFTFLSGDRDINKMFSTDVGPGNTLIDALIQKNFKDIAFDTNGEVAARGTVNRNLLNSLKDHPFFKENFPKTTGPELFNIDYVKNAQEKSLTEEIPVPDLIATLTRFSAEGIADAIKKCFVENHKPVLYLSGGGMHNPVLIKMITELLPGYPVKDTDSLGILPDAKEAVLFAILANETVSGGKIRIGNSRRGIPDVSMGKISFPE